MEEGMKEEWGMGGGNGIMNEIKIKMQKEVVLE